METNILYCGMADDITTPMLMVTGFDQLFAIDYFDSAFSPDGSWEGQKQDILDCLGSGCDKYSHHRKVCLHYQDEVLILSIGICEIINEVDDGNKWVVDFRLNSKDRKLTYFHHRNFYEIWDESIRNINHLMSIGAEFDLDKPMLKQMFQERCSDSCMYYTTWHEQKEGTKYKIRGGDVHLNYLDNVTEIPNPLNQ